MRVRAPGGQVLANIYILDGQNIAEMLANVRLIAAAPELLEALRNFVLVSQSPASYDEDFAEAEKIAIAAIAKATKGKP